MDLTILAILRDSVMVVCIVLIPPLLLIDVLIQRWYGYKLQLMLIERLDRLTTLPAISTASSGIDRRIERAESGLLILHERDKNTEMRLQSIRDDIAGLRSLLLTAISQMQNQTVSPSVQNYFEHAETGRNKLSPKLLGATEWVAGNDPNCKLSVREVAKRAGVSIGTAQAAIRLVSVEK